MDHSNLQNHSKELYWPLIIWDILRIKYHQGFWRIDLDLSEFYWPELDWEAS